MKKTLIASLLALSGLSSVAMAADAPNDWFFRLEGGQGHTSVSGVSGHISSNVISGRLGYYFTPYFGVEGFYGRFASFNEGGVSGNLRGVGLGVVGKYNFGPDKTGFFLDGRIGVMNGRTRVSIGGLTGSDTSSNAYYGLGAGYDVNRNFGVSLNYDHNRFDPGNIKINVNSLTAGVEFRF